MLDQHYFSGPFKFKFELSYGFLDFISPEFRFRWGIGQLIWKICFNTVRSSEAWLYKPLLKLFELSQWLGTR